MTRSRTTDRPPPAPRTLTAASRRVWREIVAAWELDPAALLLLRAGLEQYDLYSRARDELAAAAKLTSTSARGMTRAHPAAKIGADALREARQCFRQLGLELPDAGESARRHMLGLRGRS